jgi:hypothetical protein
MKNTSAFLLSATLACTLLTPIGDARAATKCHETIVNGVVVDRVCTKTPKYRTVCKSVWRNGIKYRTCRKVRVY